MIVQNEDHSIGIPGAVDSGEFYGVDMAVLAEISWAGVLKVGRSSLSDEPP